MTPPRLPRNWQWGLDRTGDILSVNLYDHTKRPIVFQHIIVTSVWTPVKLRLVILFGLWNFVIGQRLSDWAYRTFDKDMRGNRRVKLAKALDGDWDYRGNRIDDRGNRIEEKEDA
jgi:hypothetical protein